MSGAACVPARFYAQPGLNVSTYDLRADMDRRLFEDPLPFYLDELAATGGPLLELGCGTGRFMREAAKAGYAAAGIDLSEPMLAQGRAAAPGLEWIVGDMSDFNLGRRFAMIAIPFRGLLELPRQDAQLACLKCCRAHLRDGGHLVFDIFDPDLSHCLPVPDEDPVALPLLPHPAHPDLIVEITALRRVNDPFNQILEELWRFRARKRENATIVREEFETHRLRWIYRSELALMLKLAGFTIQAEYGDYARGDPGYGKEQVLICR